MSISCRERKQYLNEIRGLLVCSGKQKRNFMADISGGVDDFIENNPEADINDIKNSIGDPQEIAKNFLAEQDVKSVKKKTKIVKWIIIGIIVALCFWLAFGVYATISNYNSGKNNYIVVTGHCEEYDENGNLVKESTEEPYIIKYD